MLKNIITWSLHHQLMVAAATLLLIVVGGLSLASLKIDAFPDSTPVQVQVTTDVPGLVAGHVREPVAKRGEDPLAAQPVQDVPPDLPPGRFRRVAPAEKPAQSGRGDQARTVPAREQDGSAGRRQRTGVARSGRPVLAVEPQPSQPASPSCRSSGAGGPMCSSWRASSRPLFAMDPARVPPTASRSAAATLSEPGRCSIELVSPFIPPKARSRNSGEPAWQFIGRWAAGGDGSEVPPEQRGRRLSVPATMPTA